MTDAERYQRDFDAMMQEVEVKDQQYKQELGKNREVVRKRMEAHVNQIAKNYDLTNESAKDLMENFLYACVGEE